jgi:hypothetical protein
MELRDRGGNVVALYLTPMECRCMQCKQEIGVNDGLFMVFGSPYHGCLHPACAPFFSFNGQWPHPYPSVFYNIVKKPPQPPV